MLNRGFLFLVLFGFPLAAHASGNILVLYYSVAAFLSQSVFFLLIYLWLKRYQRLVARSLYLAYVVLVSIAWTIYLYQPATRAPMLNALLLALAPAILILPICKFVLCLGRK